MRHAVLKNTGRIILLIIILTVRSYAADLPSEILIKPEVSVSPQKAYVGEPVLLKYYLTYAGLRNIRIHGMEQQPDAKGFIIKKIDKSISDKDLASETKVHLMTFVLIPAEKGLLETGAGSIIITADTVSGFFDRTQQKRIVFPRKKVQVLALPAKGRPDSFKGSVGQFKISMEKYEPGAKLFEAKKIFLKVSGTGNLLILPNPELKKKPDGFKVIIEESDPQYSLNQNTLKGEKKYTALIMPEKSGFLKPGAFVIDFFNPGTGKYETCESEELAMDVAGSGFKKESQPIKQETKQEILFSPFIISSVVIIILIAAFLIFNWQKKRIARIKATKLKKPEQTDDYHEKSKNDYLTGLVKAAESGDADNFLKFSEKLLASSDQTTTDPDQISSIKNKIYECKFGRVKIIPEDMKTILEFFIKK